MTQASIALAAFLLARIYEDEANIDMKSVPHAALVQLAPGVQVWHTFGTTMPLNEVHGSPPQWVVRTDPARLHAECRAKRSLVALAAGMAPEVEEQVLLQLCAPYVRHPDFRSEWKFDPRD